MKKQAQRNPGLKYLLVVLSLVVTLGLWNGFAKQATANASSQASASGVVLPTLIPLSDIAVPQKPPQVDGAAQQTDDQPLREVSLPGTTIVQKKPPVVEQVTLGQAAPAPESADSPASAPQPVTTTGSSK